MIKEIHIGEVTNNTVGPDGKPFSKGEVLFKCETLLEDGSEYPIPAVPSFHYATNGYGIFFVPPPGTQIEVEVAQGLDKIVESRVRYRACLYSDVNEVPPELLENYPHRRGIKLPSGYLIFDDSPGAELIRMHHSNGTGFEWQKNGDWIEKVIKNKLVEILGQLKITAQGIMLGDDNLIALDGVITMQSIDPFTGQKHIDGSAVVLAEK